jgi:hypothetical protein
MLDAVDGRHHLVVVLGVVDGRRLVVEPGVNGRLLVVVPGVDGRRLEACRRRRVGVHHHRWRL